MKRTGASVNFEWAYFGVTPQMVHNYSVRWTGVLVAPQTGNYLIGFTGEDGYRLWLDGKVLVEDWTHASSGDHRDKQLHLEAGHAYR